MDSIDRLMAGGDLLGRTDALFVVQGGSTIIERYGDSVDGDTTLKSWSMAKSMLHAVIGMLVQDGDIDIHTPAPVRIWNDSGDPRRRITVWDLLTMRPGLEWSEDYVDGIASDVIAMLFSDEWEPVADTGAFAANKPLVDSPGTQFNYSSGTTNILSAIVRDIVGPGDSYDRWLEERLFDRLAMTSADPRFDSSGSWIASSYCFCTARDFATFGSLYLHEGMHEDQRILSAEWVDTARTAISVDPETGTAHSAHWWIWDDNPWGAYNCSGYDGQYIVVAPALDTVLVRLGQSPSEIRPAVRSEITQILDSLG